MDWKDAKKEHPIKKGYYATWCPDCPPQSHPLQVLKWDKDYDGNWCWYSIYGEPTHWAEIVPPNADVTGLAPTQENDK